MADAPDSKSGARKEREGSSPSTATTLKGRLMTVQELIDRLNEVEDKSRIVLISSDSEGNSYSELDDMGEMACRNEGETRHGTSYSVGLEELTPEDEENGYSEEDVYDDEEEGDRPCFVLWP